MTYNAYGLSRDIPADVKRKIRQKCGFGCVICGLGIIQYEHVDPEFKDAKCHDPDCIVLLCPQCHAKVTTKMWSKARVKLAMKSPKCKQIGYAREFFDFVEAYPSLHFGGVLLKNCPIPIQVSGYPLFKITRSDCPDEPFLLTGYFTDSNGEVSLVIEDNEWRAFSTAWDIEVKGQKITIREGHKNIHLVLRVNPPSSIIVEKLNMSFSGIKFEADGDFLRVKYPNGATNTLSGCVADNCSVGISF